MTRHSDRGGEGGRGVASMAVVLTLALLVKFSTLVSLCVCACACVHACVCVWITNARNTNTHVCDIYAVHAHTHRYTMKVILLKHYNRGSTSVPNISIFSNKLFGSYSSSSLRRHWSHMKEITNYIALFPPGPQYQ